MTKPGSTILADPEWLAHRYDAVGDAVHFRHVPRIMHAKAPFLTDEYLGGPGLITPLPFAESITGAPSGELHFIFHSAFCASTLLARAFDAPGLAMGMSEPVILNDIVGIRRRGAEPRAVMRALDGAMRLLARPFTPGEAVIVKPSNVVNPLAEAMLRLRADSRALLLFAPLPIFLASVARKGMWCRLWARELLEAYLRAGIVDLGFTPDDYFRQTDLQVAAVGWLAQHALFSRLADTFPDRIRTLDSETLLARPSECLNALAGHYGLRADAARIEAMVNGPAFTKHSKFGSGFSARHRAEEQATALAAHGDEIAKVTQWAEAVAAGAPLPLTLPLPLIS